MCIQLLFVFHLVPYLTVSYMWCTFYLSIVTGFPVFAKDNPPLGKIQNPILAQPIPIAIFSISAFDFIYIREIRDIQISFA